MRSCVLNKYYKYSSQHTNVTYVIFKGEGRNKSDIMCNKQVLKSQEEVNKELIERKLKGNTTTHNAMKQ